MNALLADPRQLAARGVALRGLRLGALGVGLFVLAVSTAASWLPARRATRIDPMEALRHD